MSRGLTSILIFLFLAVLSQVKADEPGADDIREMSRLFDFDDVAPANPEEESPSSPSKPPGPASKPKLPDDIQQQLDSLTATEKSLAEKHSAAVIQHRRALSDWLTVEQKRIPRPADAVVLESLAKSVRERGVPQGDLRYDLSRIGGAWARDRRVLLPDGRVRAKDKPSTARWEWLDYDRGILAYHWPDCGQFCPVGSKSQDSAFMTSLQWGRNKAKRAPLNKNVAGTPLDQPAAFSALVQAKLTESAKFEQKAKATLATLIKAEREKVLPRLMATVQKAPLDVAALAVDEVERLKLPANAVNGAEKVAGTWNWRDDHKLDILPDGTLRLDGKPGTGTWRWAGDRGNFFFVILPSVKQCYCCRRAGTDAGKIYTMDEAGKRVECLRVKP